MKREDIKTLEDLRIYIEEYAYQHEGDIDWGSVWDICEDRGWVYTSDDEDPTHHYDAEDIASDGERYLFMSDHGIILAEDLNYEA